MKAPVLLAPMAGACPPSLSVAVARAGGCAACGVLLMPPHDIACWVAEVRAETAGPIQLNNWIPDPAPARSREHEAEIRAFLAKWGPEADVDAADGGAHPVFAEQCDAMLDAEPDIVSSIMGIFDKNYVSRLKKRGISWFATATTVAEAVEAEAAGADVIIAQGMEAGGHRGAFDPALAETALVGLVALVPAVVDAVSLPVVAAGGVADGRGLAAALALGASAVQIGTAFLRCPEARLPAAWADALGQTRPEETRLTRAFSGRMGRSLNTRYVREANGPGAPFPAPYPVQRHLTAAMRADAIEANDVTRMQAWAGQSAALGVARPAADLLRLIWRDAQEILN